MTRSLMRGGAVLAAVTALTLAGAAPAFAHVTAQPGTATQGGYSVITLRVPNESDTAGTVALTVTLPADQPISSVRTTPIPGWTASTTTVPLDPPVQRGERTLTEAVRSVTWTAAPGTRIGPGQYLDFPLSLGPLPEVAELVLPATQTYDDGEVVAWDQPTPADGTEPERPAPTVTLTAASDDAGHHGGATGGGATASGADPAASAADTDTTARWLGGAGLLVGALGLGVGGGAALRTRRAGGGG